MNRIKFTLIIFALCIKNSFAVIIGSNDLKRVSDIDTPNIIKELAQTVGHVKTSRIFPSKCSGVLVSKSLFLTTTNCVGSYLTPGRIRIYFNNLEDDNEDRYKVSKIVLRDGPTGTVLLKLKNKPGVKQGYLKLADFSEPQTQLGYIENNSKSALLYFMTEACEVYGHTDAGEMAHNCDTTAEGAPLINAQYEFVASQRGFYFTSPVLNSAMPSHRIKPIVQELIENDI